MKKNLSLIMIFFAISLVGVLLVFSVSDKLNNTKEKQYIAQNNNNEILKIETNKDVTYVVEDYENDLTYSWSFNKDDSYKNSVKESIELDMDLGLHIFTNSGISSLNNQIENNKERLIVSFNYHGALPTKATVKINVKENFKNGEYLYLYYYNEELNQIEYMEKGLKVKDGYVEFEIDHCSNYLLTASIVQDAINNPKNINLIIIVMVVVVIVLVAATIFQNKK